MATWVKSSQDIENHPKTIRLMRLTGLDRHTVIGRLHCFWWWVQKYAESGDLTPFTASEIDTGLGFPEGQNFIEKATAAGWIDTAPYFRVHDWWDHNGPWLLAKYKKSPEKWEDIKKAYKSNRKGNSYRNSTGNSTEKLEDVEKIREKAFTASHARENLTAPDTTTALLAPPTEPGMNGSLNGLLNSSSDEPTKDPRKSRPKTPTEAEAQVINHIQKNVPFAGKVTDLDATWENRSLATETARYGLAAMQALWTLYTDPSLDSYAYAKGQRFSIREFIRQVPALTDNPEYRELYRRNRERSMLPAPHPSVPV